MRRNSKTNGNNKSKHTSFLHLPPILIVSVMVAGLKFLSKKSFNPQNLSNQERVYVRQQESKLEEERLKRRERQLTIERDAEELARARDGDSGGKKAALRFMYDAPPGLDDDKRNNDNAHSNNADEKKIGSNRFSYEKMAGDDDAAAAFRRILAGDTGDLDTDDVGNDQSEVNCGVDLTNKASSLILSGSNAEVNSTDVKSELSQLEKAVGKRNSNAALTYEEQIARFPQLKNAPVAIKKKGPGGEAGTTSNFNFKPLGAQIRNVRCMVCKVWGHSKGDRECSMSGWNPFSAPSTASLGHVSALQAGSDLRNKNEHSEDNHKLNESDDSLEYERRKRRKKEKRKKEAKHERKDRKRKKDRYPNSDDSHRRRRRSRSRSRSRKEEN